MCISMCNTNKLELTGESKESSDCKAISKILFRVLSALFELLTSMPKISLREYQVWKIEANMKAELILQVDHIQAPLNPNHRHILARSAWDPHARG